MKLKNLLGIALAVSVFSGRNVFSAEQMVTLDKGKTISLSAVQAAVSDSRVLARVSGKFLIIEPAESGPGPRGPYEDAYPHGDVVFMIGDGTKEWGETEWGKYFDVAKYLAEKKFRVIMNPEATILDIKATVQSPTISVMIWSSHGSKDGRIYDVAETPVPAKAFANISRSLKQIILNSCYSKNAPEIYKFPKNVDFVGWPETTDSEGFFSYLTSEDWDPLKFFKK